jgi:heme-degrading monooxygenase HmoA
MHVRGTRIAIPSDRIDAMITHFTGTVAPGAKQLAGNQGAVLLVNRSGGIAYGLTYWEDEAALRASEEAATSLRTAAAAAVAGTIEEVDRLEIVVLERAAPARAGTFVRLNDIRGDAARIEDAIRFTRETALPAVRAQKGFRALILAVNRQTGRGILSSVWDTLDDLKASETAAAPMREQVLAAAGNATVRVEIFESVFADIAAPVATN